MKKSILALAVVLGATSSFAQDLTSKKGENYLPEAGDYAIGIDAVPVLNYIGNFFGKTADNNYANNMWSFNNPQLAITGKYFVEDGLAYRGGIRLGFGSDKSTVSVGDRASVASSPWPEQSAMVENTMKTGRTNVAINVGMEWRKGTTRLQGFYGAEVGFMVQSSSSKYTYGNELVDATNANAAVINNMTADDFGSNLSTTTDGNGNTVGSRLAESKTGLGFGLGLRAFIGAEYFIIPKLSLGGEFGWGLAMQFSGKSTNTYQAVGETFGATSATVQDVVTEGNKTSSFGVDTQTFNPLFGPVGRLNLTFHF